MTIILEMISHKNNLYLSFYVAIYLINITCAEYKNMWYNKKIIILTYRKLREQYIYECSVQ